MHQATFSRLLACRLVFRSFTRLQTSTFMSARSILICTMELKWFFMTLRAVFSLFRLVLKHQLFLLFIFPFSFFFCRVATTKILMVGTFLDQIVMTSLKVFLLRDQMVNFRSQKNICEKNNVLL